MTTSAKASALSAFLAKHEDFRTYMLLDDPFRTYGPFVADVLGKLGKYGSLSTAQVDAVRKVIQRTGEYAAKRAAESATLSPAPSGRITFEGTVISTKVVESQYGVTTKMLVMADGNYKVWCSVPSALDGIKKDERVHLTVTLTPSDRDTTFAFGKRPTIAK